MRKYIDAFTVKRYTGIFIILAVVTVFSLMVNVTIAYLGDKKDKTNTVKVGYGEVSIDEQFSEPSELEIINTITKQVQIQNTGTVPAFVRVYAEFADSSIASQAKIKYNGKEYSWTEFKNKLNYEHPSDNTDDTDLVNSGWRYVPETVEGLGGYFYYITSLAPYKEAWTETRGTETINHAEESGGKTNKLFDSVVIDYNKYVEKDGVSVAADSNIDRIQPVEMIIYSELVQTVDTGTTKVTTKTVDEHGNAVDGVEDVVSNVYGYDCDKNTESDDTYEWKEAWRRFLKLEDRDKTVNVQETPTTPEPEPEPEPVP